MPSTTDLLNGSLGLIGASRITNIDDGSVNANHCKVFYPSLLDSLLRMNHWNFATGRANLVAAVAPPLFEFAFSYPLPADLLKVREYNGTILSNAVLSSWWWFNGTYVQRYTIEGRNLLSNEGVVQITYTARVTDPNIWDSLFYQTMMHWLGSLLANAIPKDSRKATALMQQAVQVLLPQALAADGQEGTVTPFIADDLIWGR